MTISGGIVGEATCDKSAKPTDAKSIDENTPLIKFLSHESKDTSKYHDWLHFVLMDIVSVCSFVQVVIRATIRCVIYAFVKIFSVTYITKTVYSFTIS